MKKNLKKYIKPFFKKIGLYGLAYYLFFYLRNSITILTNVFYRFFYKTAPILLYHRIATVSKDPVMLCVPPECFENHLQFIKKNYDVVSLSDLSKRIVNDKLKGNEIAITFDDGYQDNLINALPLLEKYNIPATIFVTTELLGKKASFEWDMEYKEEDRATFLNEEEVKILSSNPLVEIGAHTNLHSRLSNLTEEEQRSDVLKSREILERVTGKKIKLFAYPFGGVYDFDNTTKKIVKELGFDFSYSNTQNLTRNTKDNFCIPRLNIRECTVVELSKKLLTFYPSFFKSVKG